MVAVHSVAPGRGGGEGGGGRRPNILQSGFSDSSKSDEKLMGAGFVSGLRCVTCTSPELLIL